MRKEISPSSTKLVTQRICLPGVTRGLRASHSFLSIISKASWTVRWEFTWLTLTSCFRICSGIKNHGGKAVGYGKLNYPKKVHDCFKSSLEDCIISACPIYLRTSSISTTRAHEHQHQNWPTTSKYESLGTESVQRNNPSGVRSQGLTRARSFAEVVASKKT